MTMATTSIEWTDKTWNPVTGCTKISAGCVHCYAETMSRRLKGMGQAKYKKGFTITIHEEVLEEPLKWKKPCNVFVCSMGDLFHDSIPFEFIDRVFFAINSTPQHRYQILTKRPERLREYFNGKIIPKNVWIGTTVECQTSKERIDYIRDLDASVKFLSCEPLLEDLGELNLEGINWVIVGGESGMKARPMQKDWAISIKNQVEAANIAFFFKQWGTWGSDGIRRSKKANGNLLDGFLYQQYPGV